MVLIGIAVPSSGALLKPFVPEAIFVLLCIAFLRVDVRALKGYLRRPALVLAATVWTSLVLPVLFGLTCRAFGVREYFPDLYVGLVLQGIASPMMAAPSLAALMGLDAALVLITLVLSTALIPFTAAGFAALFLGQTVQFAPLTLGLRLLEMLLGSAFVGVTLRRIAGAARIEERRQEIDGINILFLYVFVAAVMEDVATQFLLDPMTMLSVAGLAFFVFVAVLGLTTIVFRAFGQDRALALGFMASQRNMGLMLAATGGALPHMAWLYFALSQFPIYLSPQLLRPLARRIIAKLDPAARP